MWQIALLIGDVVALIISLFLTYTLRLHITAQYMDFGDLAFPFSILFAIWILLFFIFNLYNPESVNPNPKNIGRVLLTSLLNVVIGFLFFYFFPLFGLAPKLALIFISGISFILLVIWRRTFYTLGKSIFTHSLFLSGDTLLFERFTKEVTGHPYIQMVTYVEDKTRTNTLFTAYENILGKIPVELITPEIAEVIITKNRNEWQSLLGNVFDKTIAFCVLVISSPFIILVMLAIYIESGLPIFYLQTRVGKDGKLFTCYKLRSMVKNAEVSGAQWAERKDSRITAVGNIIRKTHIDEIPQMINILKGDLALIGPRPERPEFVEKLKHDIPYYHTRQSIKPGFTGWAQIKFRYARTVNDSKEKFEYDLFYLKNKNILLDIGIFLKTIQIIITH